MKVTHVYSREGIYKEFNYMKKVIHRQTVDKTACKAFAVYICSKSYRDAAVFLNIKNPERVRQRACKIVHRMKGKKFNLKIMSKEMEI